LGDRKTIWPVKLSVGILVLVQTGTIIQAKLQGDHYHQKTNSFFTGCMLLLVGQLIGVLTALSAQTGYILP